MLAPYSGGIGHGKHHLAACRAINVLNTVTSWCEHPCSNTTAPHAWPRQQKLSDLSIAQLPKASGQERAFLHGCGSKPMVPFWGLRCTTQFSLFLGDWDVHWGYDLAFDPWTHSWLRRVLIDCTPRFIADGALKTWANASPCPTCSSHWQAKSTGASTSRHHAPCGTTQSS